MARKHPASQVFGVVVLSALVMVTTTGCLGDPSVSGSDIPAPIVYDPADDPLVNPSQLFEPYPAETPEIVARDETLVRYSLADPRSLNPLFAIAWEEWHINVALFERMVRRNADMELVFCDTVVERAEVSPDQRVFTLHLRPGLRWHDGHPWTAHDIRFTWQAILDDSVPAAGLKYWANKIKDVRVIDDLTVEITCWESAVTNMMGLQFPIVPKHILDQPRERAKDPTLRSSPYYNHYGREAVIGSGPYRFVEWLPNDKVVLERWDNHPSQPRRPAFKRLIFKIQPDRNLALLMFKKGELDEYFLTPQQFATQTNDEEFSRLGVKSHTRARRLGYIGWNMDGSNPFFADRRVRQAMAHAYDMESVIRDVTYGVYFPVNGIFDPEYWVHDPAVRRPSFDLDRASQLLDEAGWLKSDDDGWRYKTIDGEQVRFSFVLSIGQTFKDAVKTAAIYQRDLKRIGVDLTTEIVENATLEDRVQRHEFQAWASALENATDPDDWSNYLESAHYATGRNYGGYSNPEVDDLLARGRRELDRQKRAAIYQAIHRQTNEDQPLLVLWNYAGIRALHRRLRGVEVTPVGIYLFLHRPPPGSGWWTGPGWWVHRDDRLRGS